MHDRHLVEANGVVQDLNDVPDVAARVRLGGYRAQRYVEFTGDGWVRVTCPDLGSAVPRVVGAYSLVTALDFYPNCAQRELLEWWWSGSQAPCGRVLAQRRG